MSVPLKKNTASQIVYIALLDGSAIVTTPTIAAGDIQISLDGGALANPTTLPSETPASSGQVQIPLTADETNATHIGIKGHDQAGDEWDDFLYSIYTSTSPLADLATAIAALNDLSAADVNAQVDTALSDIDLDHLIQVSAGAEEPTDGSYLDQIMHKDGDQTFNATTDSLEAIRDSQVTLGAGATAKAYTLTDADAGTPIADADVWVTTDIAGNNVIASGTTDDSGQVTFYLDSGTTYYLWRQKAGYNFTNPDTEVA